MKRHLAITCLILTLSACASFGLEQPRDLGDQIAYAIGRNAGLRNAAASALTAHTIASEDAQYVLTMTDSTRVLLESATKAITAGDPTTAQGRLELTLDSLTLLEAYMQKKVKRGN